MDSEHDQPRPETFVIQVAPSAAGELAGVIHYVRTREKRRFHGLNELSAAIRGMGRHDVEATGTGSG
jgi:hypothetical protein